MRLPRTGSCARWRAAVIGLCSVSQAALAQTQVQWMQPAGSPAVEEFRIYAGPALGEGALVYAGMPAAAGGVYTADVQIDEIDQGLPVAIWLTARNESGESAPSNAVFFGEPCDASLDADCDTVPDTEDNCPFEPNPGQEDAGGLGLGAPPDGIGTACQCGDVNGDGRITTADSAIIVRALMTPPLAVMAHPERCDVGGSLACSTADSAIVTRALMTPPLASIQQQCEPARPLAP